MPKFNLNETYAASRVDRRDRIVNSKGMQCAFCKSINMDQKTLTCRDCGTTAPMNLGSNQRVDKHGNPIIAKIANKENK